MAERENAALKAEFSLVRGPMAMTLRRRRVRPEIIVHAVVAAAYLRAELLPAPVCLQNVRTPHTVNLTPD